MSDKRSEWMRGFDEAMANFELHPFEDVDTALRERALLTEEEIAALEIDSEAISGAATV